ncbi:MAG: YgjV family protein, partial [Clostridia bacterium]|nr:YgjV family protein [Clostridia bacterium]
AAATNGLCFVRESVFSRVKNKKYDKILLGVFLALYLLSAVLTWKNIFSIFPAVSSSISTVAFWLKNPRTTKKLSVCAATCTLVYNLMLAQSFSVYVGVAFTITTSIVSLIKTHK